MAVIALQPRSFSATQFKLDSLVVASFLVLGLYFPTSIDGNSSTILIGVNYLIYFLLLIVLFSRSDIHSSFPVCLTFLSIIPLLLGFTYVSGLHTFTPGALVGYGVLSVLYISNVKEVEFSRQLDNLFAVTNLMNILVCAAILAGNDLIDQFLITHYSQAYPELVPNMLFWRKPVLTFGTHSAGAFFLYLFFYMNFRAYRAREKKLFLIFALCYLFLVGAMLSVSGLLFAAIGGLQLAHYLWFRTPRKWFWAAGMIISVATFANFQMFDSAAKNLNDFAQAGKIILASPENGLLGRLAPGGTMYYDLQYLWNHPFSPVGVSYRREFMFGDCGPLEYLLRGSVILLFLVYGGLLFFLRRNLVAKSDAYFLFTIILIFELGYTVVPFFRTLYLLPFFAIYLNGLRRFETQAGLVSNK